MLQIIVYYFGVADYCTPFWCCRLLYTILVLRIIVHHIGVADYCTPFWCCGLLFTILVLIIVHHFGVADYCTPFWCCRLLSAIPEYSPPFYYYRIIPGRHFCMTDDSSPVWFTDYCLPFWYHRFLSAILVSRFTVHCFVTCCGSECVFLGPITDSCKRNFQTRD